MPGRTIVARRSTSSKDTDRRLDEFEDVVAGMALDVERGFDTGGKWETVKATSGYVAKPWQFVLCDPTAGAFSMLLPDPASCKLSQVIVKNDSSSSTTVTVLVTANGTIDGASSVTLTTARQIKQFTSDGREWKDAVYASLQRVIQYGTDANTTALPNVLLNMPTVTASRTVTLPASPANGTFVVLRITNGYEFQIVVSGNGKNIDDGFVAAAATYTIANDGAVFEFVYLASLGSGTWVVL